jgi:hypothetical protein
VTRPSPVLRPLWILGEDRLLPLDKQGLSAGDPVVHRIALFLQKALQELGLGDPSLAALCPPVEPPPTDVHPPEDSTPSGLHDPKSPPPADPCDPVELPLADAPTPGDSPPTNSSDEGASPSRSAGEEHGLGVALLLMANALGLPLRPGVLALGALESSGRLLPLSGASLVLCGRLLEEGLVGPEMVLLSGGRPSVEEPSSAERLRSLHCARDVRILGVRSFSEAANDALGLEASLRDGELTLPPERLGLVVERLWSLALEGSPPLLGWGPVAALASGLLLRHTGDLLLRWKAAFVRDVARRHQGEAALLSWPADELFGVFPRETRLSVIAHVVQSVADGDPSLALETAERASGLVSAACPSPADAILLGAIGRAEAAAGDFARASVSLAGALRVWGALGLRTESSYALCERLRILGILGEEASILELVEGPVRAFLEPPSQPGHAFVLLAVGRALAQIGRPTEAIEHLGSEVPWAHAPGHVQAARLRWLSFAQRAAGLSGQAASTLEALEHLGDVDQLHLARLDDALSQGTSLGELSPLVQKLLEAEEGGDEARRLLLTMTSGHDTHRSLRDRSVVERLCREYRYLPQPLVRSSRLAGTSVCGGCQRG